MKNFKVKVDNNKAEFFKELMDSFKFVSYEEVDSFREPRVYPGGEFEIRSPKDTTPITYSMEKAGRKLEQESKGKPTQTSVITSYSIHYTKLYDIHAGKNYQYHCDWR